MAKYVGHGTVLKVSTSTTVTSSTGATATAVGNLISLGDLTGPDPKIDTTVIADAEETCEPGTPGANEMPITVAYKQAGAGVRKLLKMRKNRTKGKLWIVFASTALSDECIKGYVSNGGFGNIARDSMIQRSFAFQPSSGIGLSTA